MLLGLDVNLAGTITLQAPSFSKSLSFMGKTKKGGKTPPSSLVFLNIVPLSQCLSSHHPATAHSPQRDTALLCLSLHTFALTGSIIYGCPSAEPTWPRFCRFLWQSRSWSSRLQQRQPWHLRPLGWLPSLRHLQPSCTGRMLTTAGQPPPSQR